MTERLTRIAVLCGFVLASCSERVPPPVDARPLQSADRPIVPAPNKTPLPDQRFFVPRPGTSERIDDRIYFAKNSDRIDSKAAAALDDFVPLFNKYCKGGKLTIEGHTDQTGGRDRNMALSKRRALAAARYLVSHGLDAGEIKAVGLGWLNPAVLAPKTSANKEAAYKENRRVVLVVKRKDCR